MKTINETTTKGTNKKGNGNMSILDKYNSTVGTFDYDTPETHEYVNLRDLYQENMDNTYSVNSLFINTKSKFGNAPVVATDHELINLPQHLTETVELMIQDQELVESVNNGLVGIDIYEYESKKWGKHYSVNFVDIVK